MTTDNKPTTETIAELKTTIAALEQQTGNLAGGFVVMLYAALGLGATAFALYQEKKRLSGTINDMFNQKAAEQARVKAEEERLAKRTPEEKLLDALVGVQKSKAELEAAAQAAAAQREVDASRKKAIDTILEAHKNGEDISRPEAWSAKPRTNGPKA